MNLSGGAGSWYTARRVIMKHAKRGEVVDLVFADTMTEDEDLYRFLADCVTDLQEQGERSGVEVAFHRLADGRDVWQVFNDKRFIGNSRIDPCSRILKRELIRAHLEENFPVDDTTCYIGIDWSESHRFDKAKPYWAPYELRAPLTDSPYLDKHQIITIMGERGIEPPRLYAMGFPHNNCGGFCVKAGHGAFKMLLEKLPERYAYHEGKENEFRERVGKDVSILRDRSGGTVTPLTLTAFRERVEDRQPVDELDLGGCACFTPDDPEADL